MKVYYNSSLWSEGRGLWGLPQKVNWQFVYAGVKRYIPVVYRFAEGIVFDIITILDEAKMRDFYNKYENIESELTPIQKRCAEQEHPYQNVVIQAIWVNGEQVKSGYSSSSSVYMPWDKQRDELKEMQKAYLSILKDKACFACQRFCVPYPITDSKMQNLLRFLRLNRVISLKLTAYPVERFYPLDISFKMSVAEKQKEFFFIHPTTGLKHTVYFQNLETLELSIDAENDRIVYITQAMYEIKPALPQGCVLQFNSSMQYSEPQVNKCSPIATSSIGIIGGADGPTSIFLSTTGKCKAGPCGVHGLPLHNCFSLPSFNKDNVASFVLEGVSMRQYDSREYILL